MVRAHHSWYRVISTGVGRLVSTAAVGVVCTLTQRAAAACLIVLELSLLAILASGHGETVAARFVGRTRPLRGRESASLRPAVAVLEEFDLVRPDIQFTVRARHDILWADAIGRHTIVMSPGLLEAIATGRARPDEVAAVLAHAIGRIRLGQTRYDLALTFWLLPWKGFQLLSGGVGRVVVAWFPPIKLAWRVRSIVSAVALTQGMNQGRALFGCLSAVVIGLSYLVPWSAHHAELSAQDEADTFVAAAGLGDALSRFLGRGRRTGRVLSRGHRLCS